jgi:hypothetical protein
MEIGNKNIQGMYLYDPLAKFTIGDFVVKGSVIYVVSADVEGVDPESTEGKNYYCTYLADRIADDSDFVNYANGSADDKFISAKSLGKILNTYMTGFNSKGIINNSITEDGSIYLRDYYGNSSNVDLSSAYTDPLDKLMVSEINNGYFTVSSEIVKGIMGTTSSTTLILRQYTYKSNNENIRVQELVDDGGTVRFRSASSKYSYAPTSEWKSPAIDENILSNINTIISYYQGKITELGQTKLNLINNFRFKKVNFNTGTNTWNFENEAEDGIYTIITKCLDSSGVDGISNIYRTHTATIDLNNSTRFYAVNNVPIDVAVKDNTITLTAKSSTQSIEISDIYCKKKYKIVEESKNYTLAKQTQVYIPTSTLASKEDAMAGDYSVNNQIDGTVLTNISGDGYLLVYATLAKRQYNTLQWSEGPDEFCFNVPLSKLTSIYNVSIKNYEETNSKLNWTMILTINPNPDGSFTLVLGTDTSDNTVVITHIEKIILVEEVPC